MKTEDKIIAKVLKPRLAMEDVDVYLPRGIKALKEVDANPIGLFRLFQRYEGARFFGVKEYLAALASLMSAEDLSRTTVYGVPEGYALARHETALTIEGPAQALLVNETLLHFLSTGTRFRTLAASFPGQVYPWAFMGARYLASDDLALATRALAEEGITSTVPRWANKYIGTESHSQIAMWAGLRLDSQTEEVILATTADERVGATIRATVAFARANPGVPLYVLGDFAARSVGCFEVFRATAEACSSLGLSLAGGRMDISKADLSDRPIIDRSLREVFSDELRRYLEGNEILVKQGKLTKENADRLDETARDFVKRDYAGMSLAAVASVRSQLDQAGLADFKLVVSSGIKLEEIDSYVRAGANLVGIGEEAAYFLNKGETNFTSDAVAYFDGSQLVPFAKEGRELWRIADKNTLSDAGQGVRLSEKLIRYDLRDYA